MTSKNAAALLADKLDSYLVPPNQAAETARGFDGPGDLDAWRRHGNACELLRTVDFTLTGMKLLNEDVSMFEESLPRWYAGLNFATTPWGSGVSSHRAVCEKSDINLLRALARVIDATKPLGLTEEDRRSLTDVLEEAHKLLASDESGLPDDIRRYLHALIDRARMIVDNLDKYGQEAVRSVALELSGALAVQADRVESQGDKPTAGRWRTAAKMLAIGFLGAAAEGATGELTAEALKQISGS